ncbi:MAG: YcjX family protein [Pseudomonadota bacterium]
MLPPTSVVRQRSTLETVQDAISDYATPTIRLGVTGLSGAGKTAFITALVRNLISAHRLPHFEASASGRLKRAFLTPLTSDDIPRFPFEAHHRSLIGDPPTWPASTRHVSHLRLTLQVTPQTTWGWAVGSDRVHLDITDYPGEWLLDLALMEQSFDTWSERVFSRLTRSDHDDIARPFLTQVDALRDDADYDEETLQSLAEVYTTYVRAARAKPPALATLGPGRFLEPGEKAQSQALTFAPLPPALRQVSGGLASECARRFEAYKTGFVKPFFNEHFSRLDRQIVLVDALAALNGGEQALGDLRAALSASLGAFRPGQSSWLRRLIGAHRIDRVLFAATKADQIPSDSHDRLRSIMRLLVDQSAAHVADQGADFQYRAIAAVRATEQRQRQDGGHDIVVLRGRPKAGEVVAGKTYDGREAIEYAPGDLPQDPAKAIQSAEAGRFSLAEFRNFAPPDLPGRETDEPWPHIGLDYALEFLLGDRMP